MMNFNQTKRVLIGIIGAGGFAREVMPLARKHISLELEAGSHAQYKLVFVETNPTIRAVNDVEVMSEEEFLADDADSKLFNIAIADSNTRKELSKRLIEGGAKSLSVFASSAIRYDNINIAEGATICDNCILTSNIVIGKYFHANIYSYIAHDCEIGDYVTFAPRVSCNGNVKIEDHAYIGTGAVIKQGKLGEPLVIGEGAIVGMGAVVTKNVPAFTTVVGNPAKPLIKKNEPE